MVRLRIQTVSAFSDEIRTLIHVVNTIHDMIGLLR